MVAISATRPGLKTPFDFATLHAWQAPLARSRAWSSCPPAGPVARRNMTRRSKAGHQCLKFPDSLDQLHGGLGGEPALARFKKTTGAG